MNRILDLWRNRSNLSLRLRLIIANIGLAAIAVITVAVIAVAGETRTNDYLSAQFSQSERQAAESNLSNSAERYAHDVDEFFAAVNTSMEILGTNTTQVFSRQIELGQQSAWDTHTKLFRLPSGSWDNNNNEAGSIFLPANINPNINYLEINSLKQLDFLAPSLLKNNPDLIAVYFGSTRGETFYYPNIDLASLLPPDFDITKRPWYVAAAPPNDSDRDVVWALPYVDAASNGLVVTGSIPVFDQNNKFRGVAAMDIHLAKITKLIGSIRYGDSGYAFLVDQQGHVIAISDKGLQDFGLNASDLAAGKYLEQSLLSNSSLDLFGVLAKMTKSQSGIATVTLNGQEKYIAFRPLPSVGYSLGLVVDVAETQQTVTTAMERLGTETRRTLLSLIGVMTIAGAFFLFVSLQLGNALIAPLGELTKSAQRISEGDLNATISARSRDEVGVLATTLQTMTNNLRGVIDATEQRVIERTAELQKSTEESQKRANELKTISEVARAISGETKLESLLNLVTNLVSETFGFYHVGVFLLDSASQSAVLRAANSPGGRRMLERGHALKIGEVGIVGYVAAAGAARIALDVGEDAVFFDNPDLPSTRSELALPLKVRNQTIGVLDVQSTERNVFSSEDVETLGVLADQIAIAIENARLLTETQQALAEIQSLYGESISRAWERKTAQNPIGYLHSSTGGQPVREIVERPEILDALTNGKAAVSSDGNQSPSLAVPIRLRNQVIGVVDIRSNDPRRQWKEDEIAIVEATVERLALALDNARLFEEASGRAAREHAVAEITSKIRETNDPQAMIRTAIQELQRALGVTRVEIIPQSVTSDPKEG